MDDICLLCKTVQRFHVEYPETAEASLRCWQQICAESSFSLCDTLSIILLVAALWFSTILVIAWPLSYNLFFLIPIQRYIFVLSCRDTEHLTIRSELS